MLTVIGTATEEEMIAVFLRAELDSPRLGERLKTALAALNAPLPLILEPDTANPEANRIRSEVLVAYRGWKQYESVFGGLPTDDVTWVWVQLEEEDLRDRVFTIAYYFEETYGTRQASAIGKMKRRTEGSVNPILEQLRSGPSPEPPILLAEPGLKRLVILEGHNRILSYLVDPSAVPFPISAMVGFSSRISEWSEW
jgi:hypothetical protein